MYLSSPECAGGTQGCFGFVCIIYARTLLGRGLCVEGRGHLPHRCCQQVSDLLTLNLAPQLAQPRSVLTLGMKTLPLVLCSSLSLQLEGLKFCLVTGLRATCKCSCWIPAGNSVSCPFPVLP